MTYVTDYMKQQLVEHTLEVAGGCLRMGKPETVFYEVFLAEVANRLCITGDIMLGGNLHGVVSAPGYSLDWFGGELSESYLCEKFLRKEWQWEVVVEDMNALFESGEAEDWWENTGKIRDFLRNPEWRYGEPTIQEFYEFMEGVGNDGSELPGHDYPRGEAGWLCAIQQRFVELK